ncbi:MAG: nucleoside hydrolase [Armatimonadota bacterium]
MKQVVIDTDAGVDDALAIVFALNSPELDVSAITTVSGNVHVDLVTENVFRVLGIAGASVPVARGEAEPLVRPLVTAPEVHGVDGLGGLHSLMDEAGVPRYPLAGSVEERPAWELLADLGEGSGVTLIALGPLTNIARAIVERPRSMAGYREIICMGGAFRTYGNTTTVAEFNIYVDPHAAQVVVGSGIPVTFLPLDVTEQVCLDPTAIHTPFIADLTREYIAYHAMEGVSGCYLHDPLAVGYAIDPTLCGVQEGFVQVETAGAATTGMTVCDLRARPVEPHPANARICTSVDAPRFLRLFLSRI